MHPSTIVLLGGANDIILKGRRIPDAETRDNLRRMIALARQRGIRVLLCSLLPVHYDQLERQRLYTHRIEVLNAWLREDAAANHLSYVDYFDALADPQGAMPLTTAPDGLHPTAAGYRMDAEATATGARYHPVASLAAHALFAGLHAHHAVHRHTACSATP